MTHKQEIDDNMNKMQAEEMHRRHPNARFLLGLLTFVACFGMVGAALVSWFFATAAGSCT